MPGDTSRTKRSKARRQGMQAALLKNLWTPEEDLIDEEFKEHVFPDQRQLEADTERLSIKNGTCSKEQNDTQTRWVQAMEMNPLKKHSNHSQRLAQEHTSKNKPKKFEQMVPVRYHKYRKLFEEKASRRMPTKKKWDHKIELHDNIKPKDCKVYPLSPTEQVELDKWLDEQLEKGYIYPSKSQMASPFFFVGKKDGKLRPTQDYRHLNAGTKKNKSPLPLIQELIDRLKGKKYFTKLDVRWGYNNIRIKEGDKWKATFKTNRGLFEPTVMFFGLTNSPATFQNMMNDLFKELIDSGSVEIYLDDILITADTLEELRSETDKVLKILQDNDLFLKPEKCEFEQERIEYLGVIISKGHAEMDPAKVTGIIDWPEPKMVKEVPAFLGFCNFYRRFIKDFSHLAQPLFALTRKDTIFSWSDKPKKVFEEIKRIFTSTPVLAIPDTQKPMRVECDSSDFATGAVLAQLEDDNLWHPVAYLSKSLAEAERNYDIHDKELLAIIRALDAWTHYLEGCTHKVEIWTDHRNLEYFQKAQNLS